MTSRGNGFGSLAAAVVLTVWWVAGYVGPTQVASAPQTSIDSDHAGPAEAAPPHSGGKKVSAEGYRAADETWPLSVDSGMLFCSGSGSSRAVLFYPDNPNNDRFLDHTFAVNDTAREINKKAHGPWQDIQLLRVDDLDMADFINDGRILCR